ncbi:DUF6221 family protein [Streptomyces albidoflavus]
MNDLITFLNARIDEDEKAARGATPGPWEWRGEYDEPWQPASDGWLDYTGEYIAAPGGKGTLFGPGMTPHADAIHIARHDPARVLAEVEAKRSMIGRISNHALIMGQDEVHGSLLRSLALPYSDHPDYRDEWRP